MLKRETTSTGDKIVGGDRGRVVLQFKFHQVSNSCFVRDFCRRSKSISIQAACYYGNMNVVDAKSKSDQFLEHAYSEIAFFQNRIGFSNILSI